MKINPKVLNGAKSLFNNPFKHGIEGKMNNTAFFLPLSLAGSTGILSVVDNEKNNPDSAKQQMLNSATCLAATLGGMFGIGGAIMAGTGFYFLTEANKPYMV